MREGGEAVNKAEHEVVAVGVYNGAARGVAAREGRPCPP